MSKLGPFLGSMDLEAILDASPFPYVIVSPSFVILGANEAYLRLTRRTREDLVSRNLFDAFPADPNGPNKSNVAVLTASLNRAVLTRQPDYLSLVQYNIPFQTAHGVEFEERYWSIIHTPILNAQGEVGMLVLTPIDVTELAKKQMQSGQAAPDNSDYRIAGSVFSQAKALEENNRMLDKEREHLLNLFKQAPGFVVVVRGPLHVIDMVNEAFYQLVGHRDIVGKTIRTAMPELIEQGYDGLLTKVYQEGEAFVGKQMKFMIEQHPGEGLSERYVDFVCQPFTDTRDETTGIFIQGHDVTEQKRAQDALDISNERLKLAVEGTGDGIWDWDLRSGVVVYSRRFREMFGYAEQDFPDRIESWLSRVHPEDLPRVWANINAASSTTLPVSAEYRFQCHDGNWKWVRSRGIVVRLTDDGKPSRMTGTITDISEQRKSEERIWYQANFDTLTGLPNRRLFRDRLEQEVRKAPRSPHTISLMFIDLDRFKEVNDLMGHDAGDQLLVQAAKRLIHCVRASDTVARLGGDEFTVILTELTDLAHVENVAQKILEALAEPFVLGKQTAYVSGSIGITLYDTDASTVEQLISNADQAMYAAKHAGRNQFRYFTPSMQELAYRRLTLAHDLRTAMASGQLEVHYQPVIDLATGQIAKAEALLRWTHPTLGKVEPTQFIPIAEETGLIDEIGDWVFREAAACARQWQDKLGKTVQISINASPIQIRSVESGKNWLRHLGQLGLLGSALAVEITEGLLLNASASVADKLFEYRDAGIQVALDDFGTGYSSMQYLKKFDIDYLKIDQSFIRDMVTDASDRTIVKSIIVMAHELGLQVIAEGIETPEQKQLLQDAGCDYAQGFLFSRAVPAPAFESLIVQRTSLA
ncbi:PAS domain S-box-containing protein/diguanylate cyclase (GGDEF)-like protein [Paucimonas lemoignei]|uniref:PAS domain S-box-containing protein/diguanylate cyclase (GGDEF)-like protein n=1 Tax=Paucimonas lemoignei TaxID=29443 RepID=A0A4R3HUT5_PAULE|nr:EAL domain-containing protein [Paucimonas lemoignei]TCS33777.1 PAS domain S-box-containing protein/diguanylate cyclase (GGDEF)-like protein [Paucimonas lemoignei]